MQDVLQDAIVPLLSLPEDKQERVQRGQFSTSH